ncbi:hypothetical protein UPYG_G00154110 [Umbra pygmaea]|uniref:Circadian associated repressor of transcription n=1 Tax=Umbra pygmaea TaxID=75934 RepID=A0ABD0XKB4_UMBPY
MGGALSAPRTHQSAGINAITGCTDPPINRPWLVLLLLFCCNILVMQSQGSTSSQPSFDSLSSSDSYLFSDSEQADEDADVFLSERSPSVILSTGGVDRGKRAAGVDSPGSQWACDSFTDRRDDESLVLEVTRGHPRVTAERERTVEMESEKKEGDVLFAQKCAELQGFIRPLLELLNGLKAGRFDRGLSSFQQSVAIDRIRRIVGILRSPNVGEKYMNTLLQVELMLRMWFPHVAPAKPTAPTTLLPRDTPKCTPLHRHTDQSHIPVKKRRLSWSDTDCATPPPTLFKSLSPCGGEDRGREGVDSLSAASREPPHPQDPARHRHDIRKKDENCKEGESSSQKPAHCSEPSFKRVCVSPILSLQTAREEKQLVPAVPPPSSRGSPAMQDSSISSTTPILNQQQAQQHLIGCQSLLVAGKTGVKTLKNCQEPCQSNPITAKPFKRVGHKSRVNLATLES